MMTVLLKEKGLIDPSRDVVCFANTGKENPETLDFVHQCDVHFGLGIVWIEYDPQVKSKWKQVNYQTASRKGEPFEALIKNFLPSAYRRFCTSELKVIPMKKLMKSFGHKFWHVVMGIRHDEPQRWGRILQNTQKEPFFYELPMHEWGTVKADVDLFWQQQPFNLLLKAYEGNCDLCFMKGRDNIVNLIREKPPKAEWWIQKEMQVGATFRDGISYAQMKQIATSQTEIDFTETYPCFCNID